MFKKFFAAIAALTQNAEALAASLAEANERFRANLLDGPADEVPALEHDDKAARKNGRKVGA